MSSELTPEFSHIVPLSEIGGKSVHHRLVADEGQRAALARRFDLVSLDRFAVDAALAHEDGAIVAKGSLQAELVQACIASGVAVPAKLSENFHIRFVPEADFAPDTEIELGEEDCDTMFHDGRAIDLGEVAAQTLGLAIDPYPRSPEAETALKKAGVKGEQEVGPFAALAALREGKN
jgi:uncharacterized metal-binding protein YceD (DUF177 family)